MRADRCSLLHLLARLLGEPPRYSKGTVRRGSRLKPAEGVPIVDIERLVLGRGMGGEPDLALRHHVHVDALRQGAVRLGQARKPAAR